MKILDCYVSKDCIKAVVNNKGLIGMYYIVLPNHELKTCYSVKDNVTEGILNKLGMAFTDKGLIGGLFNV